MSKIFSGSTRHFGTASNVSSSAKGTQTTYPDLGRSLSIRFEREFPHEIEAWEEHTLSRRGDGSRKQITQGMRIKRIWLDYWNKHRITDTMLREKLGLPAP